MAVPVVCPGVLLVAVGLAVASMVVARQTAWHLAICNSKAYLVVTADPWAHIKWGKTQ